ncbi:MAG: toxin-antitoxin system antitoxin subunit [Jiangellaceae bacterium]
MSLPDELVEEARQAVADGHAASVSGYVADALRRVSSQDTLADLVADMIAEDGEPGEDAYRWAHEVLGIPWKG